MMTQLDPSFQECSEIHTIQVFREADTIAEPIPQLPQRQRSTANVLSASVPYLDAELYGSTKQVSEMDGIGGDWAIDEMEEDAMLEVPPPPAERRGSDSTLYSFYFETPLVTTANASNLQCQSMEEDPNDDFTITSQDSESFHNTSDLQLDSLQDSTSFWEIGLTAAHVVSALNDPQTHLQEHRCTSPAHVSLQGEEQRPQPQGPFFSLPPTL